jgi:hypothetical protein
MNIHKECKKKGTLKRLFMHVGKRWESTNYFKCDGCKELVVLQQLAIGVQNGSR